MSFESHINYVYNYYTKKVLYKILIRYTSVVIFLWTADILNDAKITHNTIYKIQYTIFKIQNNYTDG